MGDATAKGGFRNQARTGCGAIPANLNKIEPLAGSTLGRVGHIRMPGLLAARAPGVS